MIDDREQTKKRALEAVIGELTAHPAVGGVFLFGSYARGDSRPDSDIDLVVVHSGPFSKVILHRDGVEFEVFSNSEAAIVAFWEQHPDDFTRFWADAQVLFDRDGSTARLETAAQEIQRNLVSRRH